MTVLNVTERRRRERLIRAGEWNDAWVRFESGAEYFAVEVRLTDGRPEARFSGQPGWTPFELSEVQRVVH